MNKRLNLLALFVLGVVCGACQACPPPDVYLTIGSPVCRGCPIEITAYGWNGTSNFVPSMSLTGDYEEEEQEEIDYVAGTRKWTISYSQAGSYTVTGSGQGYSSQGTVPINASESGANDLVVDGGGCDDLSGDNPQTTYAPCSCEEVTADYDPTVLNVTQPGGGGAGSGPFTISLAQPASTLTEREMGAVVRFSNGDVIRIRKKGADSDTISPLGGLSRSGGGSCKNCGGGNEMNLNYYGMSAVVATKMEDTLANLSVYNGLIGSVPDVDINVGGDMFRVANRRNWTVEGYDEGGNVGYEVTDPHGVMYQYYKSGSSLSAGEKVYLQKIYRPKNTTQTETITLHYDGDILDYQADEGDHKIVYEYSAGKLIKLKCYNDTSLEREIHFEYDTNKRLWKTYCASCGGTPNRYYSRRASKALYYDEDEGKNLPAKQSPYIIWDSQQNAQSVFLYDNTDRMIQSSHYGRIMNKWVYQDEDPCYSHPYVIKKDYVDDTDCRVTVFIYDAYGTGVLEAKREYHNLQSESGSPVDDIGDLANEPNSITSYASTIDGDVKTTTTTLPSGTQIIELYDLTKNGHLMSKYKKNESDVLILGEYEYGNHDGQYLLDSFHLPRYDDNNDQKYYYDSSNHYKLTKEEAPEVEIGANEGTTQKITHTKFDSLGRVIYQFSSTSSGWVGAEYTYDDYGNRNLVYNGCIFTLDGEEVTVNYDNAIVTDYDYNAYNQLVQVATIDGSDKVNVRLYFYDDDGVKIGEAAMLDDNDTYAVSAEKYTFDSEGRMIIKSVVIADEPFAKTDLVADLAKELSLTGEEVSDYGNLNLTWIHTVYGFDSYGDQAFVVQDAKQYEESSPPVERKHLKTSYTYNSLGEVTETRNPDGTATQIERDGRGLVKKRISGYYSGSTFEEKITIEYTYDDNGNLLTTTEPHPSGNEDQVKTVNVYDVFDRLVGTHKELVDNAPAQ